MKTNFWLLEKGYGSPPSAPTARLSSLDAFRRFTMFWITAGAALVNALQTSPGSALLSLFGCIDLDVLKGGRSFVEPNIRDNPATPIFEMRGRAH